MICVFIEQVVLIYFGPKCQRAAEVNGGAQARTTPRPNRPHETYQYSQTAVKLAHLSVRFGS